MQAMKGATGVLGSMNRNMNLPALQRIAMEFEKENDIMDQRQEMMDDAIDDVTGLEDEAEGEEVVEQVLEEIGVDLRQAVSVYPVQPEPSQTLTMTDGGNTRGAPEHGRCRRESGTGHRRGQWRWWGTRRRPPSATGQSQAMIP